MKRIVETDAAQAEIARLHKELDLEIEKGARNRDALNQKLVLTEQEAHVSVLKLFFSF